MFKLSALFLALTTLCFSASASDYYVVTPVKGKTTSASAITVNLASSALPSGEVGSPYSYDFKQNLQVTGDAGFSGSGVAWAVSSGVLPAGLSLNASSGILSGAPASAGSANFSVSATYKAKTGARGFTLAVAPAPVLTSALSASTSSDFGAVVVGSSAVREFTLTSTGNTAIGSVSASVSGAGLSITGNTCGTSLPAGNSCTISVTYAPTAAGTLSGSLSVASSASNSPSALTLTGSATLPAGYASVAGLTWAYYDTAVTYSAATTYCQNLTALGGGWRLPNLTEANLIANSATNRAALLAAGWGNTTWNWMWTTTLYSAGNYYVWRTDSMSGAAAWTSYSPPSVPYKVTCVRG